MDWFSIIFPSIASYLAHFLLAITFQTPKKTSLLALPSHPKSDFQSHGEDGNIAENRLQDAARSAVKDMKNVRLGRPNIQAC